MENPITSLLYKLNKLSGILLDELLHRMKNLLTRSLTGLLYVGLIVGAVLGGGWWFWALLSLFAVLGVTEFDRIANDNHVSNTTVLLDIIGALVAVTAGSGCLPVGWGLPTVAFCYTVYLIARFVCQLYIQDGNALRHLAVSLMGQLYIVLPLALLGVLNTMAGKFFVLGMFVLIWLSDTGAFCVGSLLGKNKLFPRISPNKSWEGFFGGLAFCLGTSLVYYFAWDYAFRDMNVWLMLGFGAVVCVFGTWGDLVESLIKRTLGVKDSGHLLPGHGGILDRIDSLLLVSPACFAYLLAIAVFS